jgi:RNA polymerase sigma-70 factor (ECF subfamily)
LPKTNKEAEFLALLGKHQGMLYKISNVYETNIDDRKDLLQEIIIQLWKNYDRFEARANFSTWMYRVALNTAISSYRRKQKALPEEAIQVDFYTIVDTNSQQEKVNQLYAAIQTLAQIDRAIVLLYLEDKSYKEMEEITGIKEATLRVKMKRIKEKLSQSIKANTNEY